MTEYRRHDDSALEQHAREEIERYDQVVARLTKIEENQKEMLDVWNQAKGAITFLKILASVAAGLAATWAFFNTNFTVK